jgi:hypothetical protein
MIGGARERTSPFGKDDWLDSGHSTCRTARHERTSRFAEADREVSRMVRKGGFEPPRSCERQSLKLNEVEANRSRPRKTGVGCLT